MKHKKDSYDGWLGKEGDLDGPREMHGESILGTPLGGFSVINDVQSNILNASVRRLCCPNVAF